MNWIKSNVSLVCAIIICILINELTLLKFTDNPQLSEKALNGIRLFNITLLVLGLCISTKLIGKKFAVILFSCSIPIMIFELLLRTTNLFNQVDRSLPSYIPAYLKKLDADIYEAGGYITQDGFRTWDPDIKNLLNTLITDDGCTIVILGDSFVMGDGLPANETWPAKLNSLVDCNVYPFGRNGWSSLEQFKFYETHLSSLNFDYLIVGVVSNDLHPRGNYCGGNYSASAYQIRNFSILHLLGRVDSLIETGSYAISYIDQVIKNLITPQFKASGSLDNLPIVSWGYANWERRLYEPDVYHQWASSVECFYDNVSHPTAFLLTPTTVSDKQAGYFSQIQRTMVNLKIPHQNIYPSLQKLLGKQRSRNDWANLADGHPGSRQTSLYANEALQLLRLIGYPK